MVARLVIAAAILATPPVLASASSPPSMDAASPRPAISAPATARSGQAGAARIEACVEASTTFLENLAKGHDNAATGNFSPQMQTTFGPGELAAVWQSLGAKFGKFESRGAAVNRMYRGRVIVTVPLHFKNGDPAARIVCGKNGMFVSVHFVPVRTSVPASSQ